LEHPFDIISEIHSAGIETLVIDRTPLWKGDSDRLCVQHVPARINKSSYPSWIFSSTLFFKRINDSWRVVSTFDSPDYLPGPVSFKYGGMILEKKS
jgi:hypothetical protein